MPPNRPPFIRYPVHHYSLKYTALWEGVKKKMPLAIRKIWGEGSFTIALFFSVSSNIPIAMAEKDIRPGRGEKNTGDGGGGRGRRESY